MWCIYIQNMKICQIHSSTLILFKMNSCLKRITRKRFWQVHINTEQFVCNVQFFFLKRHFLRHGIWQQKRETTYRPCWGDWQISRHSLTNEIHTTRGSQHRPFFYLYLICPAERDEELDLFVGNPALLRRILTWSGLVKRARSVPLFLREVLMFL